MGEARTSGPAQRLASDRRQAIERRVSSHTGREGRSSPGRPVETPPKIKIARPSQERATKRAIFPPPPPLARLTFTPEFARKKPKGRADVAAGDLGGPRSRISDGGFSRACARLHLC